MVIFLEIRNAYCFVFIAGFISSICNIRDSKNIFYAVWLGLFEIVSGSLSYPTYIYPFGIMNHSIDGLS